MIILIDWQHGAIIGLSPPLKVFLEYDFDCLFEYNGFLTEA